jgi:hypothetical protein
MTRQTFLCLCSTIEITRYFVRVFTVDLNKAMWAKPGDPMARRNRLLSPAASCLWCATRSSKRSMHPEAVENWAIASPSSSCWSCFFYDCTSGADLPYFRAFTVGCLEWCCHWDRWNSNTTPIANTWVKVAHFFSTMSLSAPHLVLKNIRIFFLFDNHQRKPHPCKMIETSTMNQVRPPADAGILPHLGLQGKFCRNPLKIRRFQGGHLQSQAWHSERKAERDLCHRHPLRLRGGEFLEDWTPPILLKLPLGSRGLLLLNVLVFSLGMIFEGNPLVGRAAAAANFGFRPSDISDLGGSVLRSVSHAFVHSSLLHSQYLLLFLNFHVLLGLYWERILYY